MALPVSIGDCIGIVQSALAAYRAVRAVDGNVRSAGSALDFTNTYLQTLQSHLARREHAVRDDAGPMLELMQRRIEHLGKVAKRVRRVLKHWDESDKNWFNRAKFAASKSETLNGLVGELKDVQSQLAAGAGMLHWIDDVAGGQLPHPEPHTPTPPKPNDPSEKARPSLTPPITNAGQGLAIVFLDSAHASRSRAAAAYALLLKAQGQAAGRIGSIASAGTRVVTGNECLNHIDRSSWIAPVPSTLKANEARAVSLASTALAVSAKVTTVEASQAAAFAFGVPTAGIKKSVFRDHDYLFVFTKEGRDFLLAVQTSLVQVHGREAILPPRDSRKGQIVLLSDFDPSVLRPRLLEPDMTVDGWSDFMSTFRACYGQWLLSVS